ncbi:MAG: hypothetical protein HRU15_08880, partial [Planctomycetes bacterium]|nr:hypothetical protein [Planctomycetota bacterium]
MNKLVQSSIYISLLCYVFTANNLSAAADLDTWLNKAFDNTGTAINYLQQYDSETHSYKAELHTSLQVGHTQETGLSRNATLLIQGEKVLRDGKEISFSPYANNHQDKKNHAYVCKWTVTLKEDQKIYLKEYDHHGRFKFTRVFLNGRALSRHNDMWISPQSATLEINGKKGLNVIVAECGKAYNQSPNDILNIIAGPAKERALRLAKSKIDSNTSEPDNGWQIQSINDTYSYLDVERNEAQTIADGMRLYIQHYHKYNDEKKELERKTNISNQIRNWTARASYENMYQVYSIIRNTLPQWAIQDIFLVGDKFHRYYANKLALSYAWYSTEEKFDAHVLPIFKKVRKKSDNNDGVKNEFQHSVREITSQHLPRGGFYHSALKIIDLNDGLDPVRDQKRFKGQLEQKIQTKANLSGNPEAVQYLSEFETLVSRGADDDRAVDSIVSIFRKAGHKLIINDLHMSSLSVHIINELIKDNALYKKVVDRAQEQFNKRAAKALAIGNLSAMNDLISDYSILIDAESIHGALLNEHMDRCAYNRARYHALLLLKSKSPKIVLDAVVKLAIVENALDLPLIERSTYPNSLKDKSVMIAGKNIPLSSLITDSQFNNSHSDQLLSPGPLLGSMSLGQSHGLHEYGDSNTSKYNPYSKQIVEPRFNGSSIICSTPTYIKALDAKTHKESWAIDQGAASSPPSVDYTSIQCPVEIINGYAALLWSHPGSQTYTIRAYNKKGTLVWDLNDSTSNQRWSPICTPYSAFGMLFCIVFDNTVKEQKQMFLAILNGRNGEIEKTIAINTLFDSPDFDRAYNGMHFTHNNDALYGISGTGVMFKVNRKSLNLDWANGRISRSLWRRHTPSAFIKTYNNIVISHIPSIQEWVGIHNRSGRIAWRHIDEHIHYIHSRNTDSVLIVSGRQQLLRRMDIKTGTPLWSVCTYGMEICGEGSVVNDIIYLPCKNGIAKFNAQNGTFIQFTKTPQTINKIRVDSHAWYFLTRTDIFVCKHGGIFKGSSLSQTSTLFSKHTKSTAEYIDTIKNLTPVSGLAHMYDPRSHINFHKTGLAHYYLMKIHNQPQFALFREAHTDAQGQRKTDKILWMDASYRSSIQGNKLIAADYNILRIMRLPSKEVIFEIDKSELDLSNENIRNGILHNNSVSVFTNNNYHTEIITFDITTRHEIARRRIIDQIPLFVCQEHYILRDRHTQKKITAYHAQSHKPIWTYQNDSDKGINIRQISPQHYLVGNKNLHILEIKTGKKVSQHGLKQNVNFSYVKSYAQNRIFWENNKVFNIKTGNTTEALRICAHKNVGAAIISNDENFTWHDSQGTVKLEYPSDAFMHSIRSRWNPCSAFLQNNTVFIYSSHIIVSYDRTNGRKTGAHFIHSHENNIKTVLNNSILITNAGKNYIFRNKPAVNSPLNISMPRDPDKQGWPLKNWSKPQRLSPQHWVAGKELTPTNKYALQFGHTFNYYYLRVLCSPRKKPQSERLLKVSLAYPGDEAGPFEVNWDIDRSPTAIVNISNESKLKTWKRVDHKGNVYCYFIFNYPHKNYNWTYDIQLNTNIQEFSNGTLDGSFVHGGIANIRHRALTGDLQARKQTIIQEDDDFIFRKNIYSNNSKILTQGTDFSKWVQTYRGLYGFNKTIHALKEMCQRCKESTFSVNILACLLNERLNLWHKKNPHILETSQGFRKARKKIMHELQSFAQSAGVDKNNIDYGLSYIAIEVFPHSTSSPNINQLTSHGSRELRGDCTTQHLLRSPFANPQALRPHVAHHFLGAFTGAAPQAVAKLSLNVNHSVEIGNIEYISPNKHITIIDRQGNVSQGCKGYHGHHGIMKPIKKMPFFYDGKRFDICDYETYHSSVEFDAILLPKLKEDVFNKEELLLALENLPSDSSLGDDIIQRYGNTEGDEFEKLWKLVLRQTVVNPRNDYASFQAIEQLRRYYSSTFKSPSALNKKCKELMVEFKVPRSLQQRCFHQWNNSIHGSDRWFDLGGIITAAESSIQPL